MTETTRQFCGRPVIGQRCVRDLGHEGPCYPSAIRDGSLLWLSVSSIEKYTSESPYSCPRAWGFRYIDRIRPPQGDAQRAGDAEHAALARYALTGEDVLTPVSRAGKHFVYAPGPGLAAEVEEFGALSIAGVPVYVRLDVLNARDYWLDDDGEARAQSGNVEACDWKTVDTIAKKAKTAKELQRTVQMPVYGAWALELGGGDQVRLSHGYFGRRKREALKVSTLMTRTEVEDRVAEIGRVVERMKNDAAAPTGAHLAPNWNACQVTPYRACEYVDRCPRSYEQQLHQIKGLHVDRLLEEREGEDMSNGFSSADLMARLNAGGGAPAPVAAAPTVAQGVIITAPAPAYTQADVEAAVRAKMLELAAAGQLPQAIMPQPAGGVYVTGPAAQVVVPGIPAGSGVITSPSFAAGALGIMPSDAPTAAPAAQAIPPEQLAAMSPAIQAAHAAVIAPPVGQGVIIAAPAVSPPPGTGVVIAAPAVAPTPPSGIGTSPSVPEKKTRARKEKTPGAASLAGLVLLVNVTESGLDAEPLEPYVDDLLGQIAATQNGGIDVRCAGDHEALGFGKWRGVLATFAKAKPPAPGSYTIFLDGSEARSVVVEALRPLCTVYVRGGR